MNAADRAFISYVQASAASCEIYGLLKRPDEKYVTDRAYVVEAENFESIHIHSAYAGIARRK